MGYCGGIEDLGEYKNIVQIIPADGWKAVFLWENASEKDAIGVLPLVCWALVEDKNKKRNIFGVIATGDGLLGLLNDDDAFFQLLSPVEKVDDIRERAMREWRRLVHE